jgi:hypothetical protein
MAGCECLPKCPFFNDNMKEMPKTAQRMKNRYCLGKFEECARFLIFKALGRDEIPQDLIPIKIDTAKSIIIANQKNLR